LVELHRAIIYTTEISKQVTKSDVRDAVHFSRMVVIERRTELIEDL
jgi:hypothetical protein